MEGYPYEETFKDRRSAACRRNGHATEKLGKIDATNSNVKLDTEWAKAAVVVRTNEKGSYAAIAIQVKNLNYPKT